MNTIPVENPSLASDTVLFFHAKDSQLLGIVNLSLPLLCLCLPILPPAGAVAAGDQGWKDSLSSIGGCCSSSKSESACIIACACSLVLVTQMEAYNVSECIKITLLPFSYLLSQILNDRIGRRRGGASRGGGGRGGDPGAAGFVFAPAAPFR